MDPSRYGYSSGSAPRKGLLRGQGTPRDTSLFSTHMDSPSTPQRTIDRNPFVSRFSQKATQSLLENLNSAMEGDVSAARSGRAELPFHETSSFGFQDSSILSTKRKTPEAEDEDGVVQFYEALREKPLPEESFDLIELYQSLCNELFTEHKERQAKNSRTLAHFYELEGDTWRLVRALFYDRVHAERRRLQGEEPPELEPITRLSEKLVAQRFLELNDTIRESQLVVNWLEDCARRRLVKTAHVEGYSDWENTVHVLLQQDLGVSLNIGRPVVNELDPDGPFRQQMRLHELDEAEERRVQKHVFDLIRSGNLDEVRSFCGSIGRAWQLVALEGWRLYHNPRFSDGVLLPAEGSIKRDLWKRTAWQAAEDKRRSPYSRALSGCFAVHLDSLLLVSNSWEDQLWSHLRSFVDVGIERELRSQCTHKRRYEDMPPGYWDRAMAPEKVFSTLEASLVEEVRHEARLHFRQIQKFLILGKIRELGSLMRHLSESGVSPFMLRFLAHLALFLLNIGVGRVVEDDLSNVVARYILLLTEHQYNHLVSFYAARLPDALQTQVYAQFLAGLDNAMERIERLSEAQELNFNWSEIAILSVQQLRERLTANEELPNSAVADVVGMTAIDEALVEAIELLLTSDSLRLEALCHCNALVRRFLLLRKITAARRAFGKLPPDTVRIVEMSPLSSNQGISVKNLIKEHLCFRALLQAYDAFDTWFSHLKQAPNEPQLPEGGNALRLTDRVAVQIRLEQFERAQSTWQQMNSELTTTVRDALFRVLTFPDGGWLIDEEEECNADRVAEVKQLRRIYLAAICALLLTVLQKSARQHDALRLIDALQADEDYHLREAFHPDDLRQLHASLQSFLENH